MSAHDRPDPPGELPTPDPLPLAELTAADLASVGLTPADLTPELVAALADTRRLLATAGLPPPPEPVVRRWHAALATLPPPTLPPPNPSSAAVAGGSTPAAPAPRQAPAVAHSRPSGQPPTRRSGRPRAVPSGRPTAERSTPAGWRLARWAPGWVVLAAAAAVVFALPATLRTAPAPSSPAQGSTSSPAERDGPPGGLALGGAPLPPVGQDYGPLVDPARRAACLARLGDGGATPLGARQVRWHGRPAVALVLPTAVPGRVRMLVVTPDCGELLADVPMQGK